MAWWLIFSSAARRGEGARPEPEDALPEMGVWDVEAMVADQNVAEYRSLMFAALIRFAEFSPEARGDGRKSSGLL